MGTKLTAPGSALEQARRDRGWSQHYLGARVGVSGGYVGQVERGEKAPSLWFAERVTELFGIPSHELFPDGDPLPPDPTVRAPRHHARSSSGSTT